MADLNLDILVSPTYSTLTLGVIDNSTYVTTPPSVTNPTIKITVPGFDPVELDFNFNTINIFDSFDLDLSEEGISNTIPDGIYTLEYSVNDGENIVSVTKFIMRVDKLQEKFDEAFMTLDMMECDRAIKKQSKVELTSIYFFIQGSIAAANNCSVHNSNKLYKKAEKMLDSFIKQDCGCSGNNFLINYF